MIRRAILVALQAVLFSACASAGQPGLASTTPSASSPPPLEADPSASPAGSRVRPSLTAAPIRSGPGDIVTGTLGFDAIEGGCAFLETAEGTRYQVIYPDGWSVDRGTGRLVGPGGRTVGPGGHVTVRGAIATDIASICQVGPMFRALEVVDAGP